MATITKPVGGAVPNLNRHEVKLVQKLLNKHRMPPLRPIAEDGVEGAETRLAIEEFQRRVVRMAKPDGRVDPNGASWKALNSVAPTMPAANLAAQFFPFSALPSQNWTAPPRSFAANRSNGTRAHAGCDLYYPNGTWIHAIAAGTVVKGSYAFYAQTYALEIDHGTFLARYGEIQQVALVSEGQSVQPGQKIAKVGHLVGISVPSDMLHLELYSKSGSGPLTVSTASTSKKRSDGVPFFRRTDLIDPTPKLNIWKSNLPPA
jgi:murein DD-endopeptidase MepM/ murein hydrolase activator NlpD